MPRRKRLQETEEIEAAVASPKAPITSLPDRTPKITASRFFVTRMKDPLVVAFLTCEQMNASTRRLTRSEWASEYDKFLAEPRTGGSY